MSAVIPKRPKTRDRIVDSALVLFNEQGFASTPISQIAGHADMTVGNLWYHFRTKRSLLFGVIERAQVAIRTHLDDGGPTIPVLVRHVRLVYGVMQTMWAFRFLLRDRLQFGDVDPMAEFEPLAVAHFARLCDYLGEMEKHELFSDPPDLDTLATNLWIVVRYWGDFVREREGAEDLSWELQERGFRQHLAVLAPLLRPEARLELDAAAEAARSEALS